MRLEREDASQPFFGRCYAGQCQTNYSSIKYLLAAGMDYIDVAAVHGRDPDSSLRGLTVNVDELLEMAKDGKSEVELVPVPEDPALAKFFRINDWIDHPAAVYAIKRGVPRELYDRVLIDPEQNAVVFVVKKDDVVVGYQRRFVNPVAPHLKTKSSLGFKKTQHLLHFPKENAKIVVCEGPFTAIAAWQYGYYAVCTFGSGVSAEQVRQIAELSEKIKQPVGVAFDLDAAGKKGFDAIRSGMFWMDRGIFKVEVDAQNLPAGFDLGDAFEKGMKVKETESSWSGPAIPDITRFV
jgi:hypothetical protein